VVGDAEVVLRLLLELGGFVGIDVLVLGRRVIAATADSTIADLSFARVTSSSLAASVTKAPVLAPRTPGPPWALATAAPTVRSAASATAETSVSLLICVCIGLLRSMNTPIEAAVPQKSL
jgi:hypothetical protein